MADPPQELRQAHRTDGSLHSYTSGMQSTKEGLEDIYQVSELLNADVRLF